MKNSSIKLFLKKSLVGALVAGSCMAGSVVYSAEEWKPKFDEICSKTRETDNLTLKDLTDLIDRSDKLMPEIQSSSDPSKKIYMQRLKKCKSLFEFIVDSKKEEGK